MNRKTFISVSAGLMVACAASAWAETSTSRRPILRLGQNFVLGERVPGTYTKLWRNDDGIAVRVRTGDLTPGIYTLEWLIFNNPEYCSRPFECDILDADPGWYGDPRVRFSWILGSSNFVVGDGRGTFAAGLSKDDPSLALPRPGLIDSHHAEVHLVIHRKSPVLPEAVHLQLSVLSLSPLSCQTQDCRYVQISRHRVTP